MSDEELQNLAKEIQKEREKIRTSTTSKDGLGSSIPSHSEVVSGGKVFREPGAAARAGQNARSVATTSTRSNFFAYDPKSVKRGKREFEREWGDRPLADNWRLASRLVNESGFEESLAEEDTAEEEISESQLADIFKDVPRTDEERAASHGIIQNAMLQLGSLYREKLEDYPQSIDVLESLLAKYPDTEHKLDAYYQLYLSYILQGDVAKSNYYKNKIIDEFSQSKYALVLSDPDYFAKQLSEAQKLRNAYEEVFDQVENNKYTEAREMILKCREQYGTNHDLEPKMRILEAMCIGNLEGRDAYVSALKDIVGAYPNTPEETKARDMLLLLGEYKGSRLNLDRGRTGTADFRVDPNARHYVLVMIHNFSEVDMSEAKLAVHNFNNKYHRLDRLKVNSLVFDPATKQTLILIRTFKDGERAMAYQVNAVKHTDEYLPASADYDIFPVSEWNYRQIIKQRSIEGYRSFFETNYKSGTE
jgi:tetratricopeptide (TPR) repeat protein